jgi:hypothetical protein
MQRGDGRHRYRLEIWCVPATRDTSRCFPSNPIQRLSPHGAVPAAILYARQRDRAAPFTYMTADTYACIGGMQE